MFGEHGLLIVVVACFLHVGSSVHLGEESAKDVAEPDKPKSRKIRVVLMSDTHGFHRQYDVPQGDVLIHAGDVTDGRFAPEKAEVDDFDAWLGEQKFQDKIVVGGNHDGGTKSDYQQNPDAWKALTQVKNGVYLEDNSTRTKDGLLVWGSPWTTDDPNMFTYKDEKGIKSTWSKIDKDTVILVTHQQPCSYLQDDGGCDKFLKEEIDSGRLSKLKLVVYGHSHCPGHVLKDGITFINAAINDEDLLGGRDEVEPHEGGKPLPEKLQSRKGKKLKKPLVTRTVTILVEGQ